MFTRKQYMNKECTHREYYGQFVTAGTIEYVRRGIGEKKIMESSDPVFFNDIRLYKWDRLVSQVPGSRKFKEAGDVYTLAGGVCLLKEAARQFRESSTQ